jgi:hypothetical protein
MLIYDAKSESIHKMVVFFFLFVVVIGPSAECAHNLVFVMTYLTFTVQQFFNTCGVNMASLLTVCAKEEQCAGVLFIVG